MKRFNEFLIETPSVNIMTDSERYIPQIENGAKSIGQLSSGHKIVTTSSGSEHNFWAVKDGSPSFHLQTHYSRDTDNHTIMAVAKRKSEKSYKAVDVYKHLLKRGYSLVGVDHSEGAKEIWRSLSTDKDINLSMVSSHDHSYIGPLPKNFDDVYKPGMSHVALRATWNGKIKNKPVPKEPERFNVRDFIASRMAAAQQNKVKKKPVISESPSYMGDYGTANRGNFGDEHKKLKNWPKDHKKMIADIGTHEIWKLSLPFDKNVKKYTQFYAVNKSTGKPTHVITGWLHNSTLKETGLYSTGSKEAKAGLSMTDLYAHILNTGEIKAVHSDALHSPGGANVWKRLAKRKDIEIKHLDTRPKREIHLDHDDWESNYDSPTSYFTASKKEKV